jgi:hypothetical protein
MRLFRLLAFIIFFWNYAGAQDLVITDVSGISFRDENYIGTPNKTLEYLKYGQVQEKVLKELYALCSKRWNLRADTSFGTRFQSLKRGNIPAAIKLSNHHAVSIQLKELAATEFTEIAAKDTEDARKINGILHDITAIYQVKLLYTPPQQSGYERTGFFLVQRKPGNGFGVYSPEYDTSPSGFQTFLLKAVQILLDTSTLNESIQIVGAQPAIYADNFMMPYIAGRNSFQTATNKGYTQIMLTADTSLLLRFDSSKFFGLNIEARNTERFPLQIRKAIELGRKNRSYQYAIRQQEFRSVLADHSYFSSIIEMADPAFLDGYSSYLKYMPGNFHVLLRNTDTIARFEIAVWKPYPERKFYFNKLYNGIDTSTMLEVDMPRVRNTQYQTPQEFEGLLFKKPFKVIAAPAFAYREIYFNGNLAILARGFSYPENLLLFDKNLSAEEIEALLILAFIETEPMMSFKNR